jgi:hypothetical protein
MQQSSSSPTTSFVDDGCYREEFIELPGRPADAPRLIQAFNHPLVPSEDGRVKRVLIWFMLTTREGMRTIYEREKKLNIPYKLNIAALVDEGAYTMVK